MTRKLLYRICAFDQVWLSPESELFLAREHLVYKFAVEDCDFWLILS